MKTYKVLFNGTAYIQADNKEIAEETLLDDLCDMDFDDVEIQVIEVEKE